MVMHSMNCEHIFYYYDTRQCKCTFEIYSSNIFANYLFFIKYESNNVWNAIECEILIPFKCSI